MRHLFESRAGKMALLVLAAVASSRVLSHDIPMACQGVAEIRCKSMLSDTASLTGATVRVLSYQDVVQWTGKVDARGEVIFKRPAGKFYVQLITTDGHMTEVDHAAIKR
ncbi:MAG: hypothetical protein Q4G39_08165 [Brachymonas sp.]|nr:hypothetical protein [Brachymonas sp.]